MARCGRCGLWNAYPEDHDEKKYAGTCLWYQIRLPEDAVYEKRECSSFTERIPQLSPLEHFDYKKDRDAMGVTYREARRGKWLAYVALVLSLLPYLQSIFRVYFK